MEQQGIHPETLKEQPPESLNYFFSYGTEVLAGYGWYILGAAVAGLYVWHNWLMPRYEQWRRQRDEDDYAAKYHKDPDVALSRQQAMEEARKKMQEENDAKAAVFAEKQKQKEEERRREKEAERARLGLGGHRLGDTRDQPVTQDTPNNDRNRNNFRPEYNPLIGGGGSGGYRPARRSCPGGGCG